MSTASSWLWLGNKYYGIYYNIWLNVDKVIETQHLVCLCEISMLWGNLCMEHEFLLLFYTYDFEASLKGKIKTNHLRFR